MNDVHVPSSKMWWGTFDLAVDDVIERMIGPLSLSVERSAREWRVSASRQKVAVNGSVAEDSASPEAEPVDRYAVEATVGPLRVLPAVADRPVITEPVTPLYVTPSGRVTLYLSTPLWYRIEVGDPPMCLRDDFIVRPSDTWFGRSTREGELCYASRTAGRLELDEIPLRPERAVTAITIRNDLPSVLPILRLSVPAPQLALYVDDAGMLWTQDVTLDNREEEDLADLIIDAHPPVHANNPQLVSAPREANSKPRLFRAFGAIFR